MEGRGQRRIAVVGACGAGKSTMARAIACALRLPLIDLDAINWQAGWRDLYTHDLEAFVRRVQAMTAAPAWVVDGNYRCVQVLPHATEVVWLDLPYGVVMRRVIVRSIARSLTRREVWPGTGNVEYWRHWLNRGHPVWRSLTHFARRRRRYEAAFNDPCLGHLRVHRLSTRAQVSAFVTDLSLAD